MAQTSLMLFARLAVVALLVAVSGCKELQEIAQQAADGAHQEKASRKGKGDKTRNKEKEASQGAGKKKNKEAGGEKVEGRLEKIFAGGKVPVGLKGFTCSDGALSCSSNDCYEKGGGSNNDSEASATPLGFGDEVRGVACKGDWDYFKVKAPVGCRLDVRLSHKKGESDLDIYVYSQDPKSGAWSDRAHSNGESGEEFVSYVTRSGEEHRVAVVATRGGGSYTLKVDAVCAELRCPLGDAFEDEDGDDKSNEELREATSALDGDVLAGNLCKGDVDFYTLNTAAMGTPCNPEAVLRFSAGDAGVVDLRLETTVGAWEGAKVSKGSGVIRGNYGQKLGTQPFFKVVHAGGDKAAKYELTLGCVD